MNSFNLADLWRKFHRNESLFTWHYQSSAILCRLDYWLVSKHLLPLAKECSIIPVSISDHSAVPSRNKNITYLEDNRLNWDMLKMEIRSFTLYYCKQNAKTKKAEEAVLQQKLSSLHKLMCENRTQEHIPNCYEVKMKLEQISLHNVFRQLNPSKTLSTSS